MFITLKTLWSKVKTKDFYYKQKRVIKKCRESLKTQSTEEIKAKPKRYLTNKNKKSILNK